MSNRVPVEFLKLRDNVQLPQYATEGAAACDLVISDIEFPERDKAIVKLGFATDIPPGWQARIQPRSSFSHRGWIMANSPGIIDSDYRGEWMIKFQAIPNFVHNSTSPQLHARAAGNQYVGGDSNGVGFQIGFTPGITVLEFPIFPYSIGERVAQVVFEPVHRAVFIEVDHLTETKRGEGGFGSTGLT